MEKTNKELLVEAKSDLELLGAELEMLNEEVEMAHLFDKKGKLPGAVKAYTDSARGRYVKLRLEKLRRTQTELKERIKDIEDYEDWDRRVRHSSGKMLEKP